MPLMPEPPMPTKCKCLTTCFIRTLHGAQRFQRRSPLRVQPRPAWQARAPALPFPEAVRADARESSPPEMRATIRSAAPAPLRRVARLMIVSRIRERYKQRGHARCGDFSDCARARAANEQIGFAIRIRHIVDKRD